MKEIYLHQNEQKILLLQFLSRKIYNQASAMNISIWILALLSAFIPPIFEKQIQSYLGGFAFLIPLIFTITSTLLENKTAKKIDLGADTKELIDRLLFYFPSHTQFDNFKKDEFFEKAIHMQSKFSEEYQVAIKNTGENTPPGVRDWYFPIRNKLHNEQVFHYQKENRLFDKSLSKHYGISSSSILLICIIIFIFFFRDETLFAILFILSGYIPLIKKLISDFINFLHFNKITTQLDFLIHLTEMKHDFSSENLIHIQELIYKRRKINYIPINFLHRMKSVKLHKLWRDMTKYGK